jgi:RimJ/RimL family protein N-acetyltransferase
MHSMIVIETARLFLRQFEEADLEDLHRILSDPITMRFWPAPFSLEQSRAWLHRHLQNYREHGWGRYAVILKEHPALIGDCGLVRAELDGRPEIDLGYIIARDFWGHGYATEAAEACKTYGVNTLGLHRICANMAADHVVSRRVAERIGMRREREFHNPRNRNLLTYLYVYEVERTEA